MYCVGRSFSLWAPDIVHSWNTGGEPELISVLHTDCTCTVESKQFTILQLVQLSSVKSSSSFTPYNVHLSQSTLLVGDVTNRQRACCRLVSIIALYRATGSSSSLYTNSVNAASQFKSLCQEFPRLVDLILVLGGGSFRVIVQQWALSSNEHVR